MNIETELTQVRQKLDKTTSLINEIEAERRILLDTMDRLHQLGQNKQVFLQETLRLKNKIRELEEQ